MRFLLALCLLQPTTSQTPQPQTLYHICGTNYTDATENCAANPTCPNGDGCPADKDTCFVIPEDACVFLTDNPTPSPIEADNFTATFSPTLSPVVTTANATDAPIASPTAPPQQPTHIFVCGVDYSDAATKCVLNAKCPQGDGCGNFTCYAIPAGTCQSITTSTVDAGSNGTTTTTTPDANETVVPTTSPSNATLGSTSPPSESFTAQPSENATVSSGNRTGNGTVSNETISTASPSDVSLNTTSPTPAPTYNTRFCGVNYTDANDNCSTERECPGGFECVNGETCFGGITCPVPTPVPTEAPTANNRFCGTNYTDAEVGCSFERACPMGTECLDGLACFSGIFCPPTSLPPSPAPTAPVNVSVSPTDSSSIVPTPAATANTQLCGTNYTDALASCGADRACPLGTECGDGMSCFSGIECPVTNVTNPPTPSLTRNSQYCGTNWTDAVADCSEERACPNGFGCPGGMTCYTGVTCPVETASPSPAPMNETDSPTATVVPTPAPTARNAHFCGTNYTDAEAGCSFERACPLGFECEDGTACFANITCPALDDSTVPTQAPNGETTTSSPSIRGSVTSTPVTPSPSNANLWYCGSSPEDAADNCATNKPCPTRTAHLCDAGQTCFSIPESCNVTTFPPSNSVTNSPTDFRNITSFCGTNWTDARDNCYTSTPCTSGSSNECPGKQGCFEGILNCAAPNRTGAAFFNPYGQESTSSSQEDKSDESDYGLNHGYIRSSSCLSWGRPNVALFVAGAVVISMILW